MTRNNGLLGRLFLPVLIAIVALLAISGAGQKTDDAEAAPTQLTVGLDMKTTQTSPGTYNINSLPTFEPCVDVSTSVNSGIFYVDLFVLNVTNLLAHTTDISFDTGRLQVLGIEVGATTTETPKLFGASTDIYNFSDSVVPPVTDGTLNVGAVDLSNTGHTGHGVLGRIRLQGFNASPGGNDINFRIEVNPAMTDGVVLTDVAGNHPNSGSDGLFDGPFINQQGTIALNRPDGDGDGVSNTCDNCPTTANASQLNTDGDSQGDACDSDDDNDGINDGSDNCPLVYNPTQDPQACLDSDGDGVLDGNDNCPSVPNANQLNNDNDSQGDVCDADDDNDGVNDTSDNCPFASNPTQANWNGNSTGDACEDADGDGWLDAVDNCKSIANVAQTNSDGDAIGDVCDNCPTVSNSNQADVDGDFIGDACDDSDGDAWMDMVELYVGTNRLDRCANTTTANDESPDAEVLDITDNRIKNTLDIATFITRLNAVQGQPNFDVRWDFDMNARINSLDIVKYIPYLNASCTP